jgi:hypothetical protein
MEPVHNLNSKDKEGYCSHQHSYLSYMITGHPFSHFYQCLIPLIPANFIAGHCFFYRDGREARDKFCLINDNRSKTIVFLGNAIKIPMLLIHRK